MVPLELAEIIFDLHESLMETSGFEGSEERMPDAVIDVLQINLLAGADLRDAEPAVAPANPAVCAERAYCKWTGGLKR